MKLRALLLSLIWVSTAIAQDPEPEKPGLEKYAPSKPMVGVVDLLLNYYQQGDDGGNPNQTEEVSIFQPMLLVNFKLSEEWNVLLTMQSDLIMGASSSSSGASGRAGGTATAPAFVGGDEDEDEGGEGGGEEGGFGVTEIQYGGSLSVDHMLSPQTHIGGGVSFSREDNYQSFGAFVKWSHETADKNDAFGIRLLGLSDTVQLDYFDGTSDGEGSRKTLSPGFAWTHILGPRTLFSLNYDLTIQSGELGTASQSVVLDGTEAREVLPDLRIRHAFHGRLRHLLAETLAIEPGVALYLDSWGASAHSLELSLHWEAVANSCIIRPSYRFHDQSAVDYFVESGSMPEFRTQDSDLGDFSTHSIGLKVSILKSPLLGDEFDVSAEYSRRSDGIDWFTIAIGFRWK